MDKTLIEWTDFSSNPIKYRDAEGKSVWGCIKCSAGCANCYSESTARWRGRGGPFSLQQMNKLTPYFCEKEAGMLLRSTKLIGQKVFIGDMTDVFGDWVRDALLDQLFAVFALRPDVTFQVLTKRPERMAEYLNDPGLPGRIYRMVSDWLDDGDKGILGNTWDKAHTIAGWRAEGDPTEPEWILPLPNVWLGTSVENQEWADKRIPHLLRCPAAVRFLSIEPLLEAVDLNGGPIPEWWNWNGGINWVIVGGESGQSARPMHPDWARSLRDQCVGAGVPFFFKQWGMWTPGENVDRQKGTCKTATFNGEWSYEREDMANAEGHRDDQPDLYLVGKKEAGRKLDGRTWDEMPKAGARVPA